MTTSEPTRTNDISLTRDVLYAARYYLRNPWVLLALGTLAIVLGLAFGGWTWLVAAGLAPLVLSTLPCLVMCAFGVCMMCRSSQKQSGAVRDAAEAAGRPTTPTVAGRVATATDASSSNPLPQSIETAAPMMLEPNRPGGVASCCHTPVNENKPEVVVDLRTIQERRDSHA